MHVVIVDTTFTTPPTGGAHTFLVDLSSELLARGWRVSVVSQPGPDRAIGRALKKHGVEVVMDLWQAHRLPEERAARLAKWVNEMKPEVYLISASPDAGWLVLPLLDNRIATFSVAHNDVSAFYEPLDHYHQFIDCAVAVSEAIQQKIIRDCQVPAERARHIPYGVRQLSVEQISERSLNPATSLAIGYVGRIVQEQKRVMDFVPLVRELIDRKVPFRLKLIGDGPDRKELEARFAEAGVLDHVDFAGWLSPLQVSETLRALDVFILVSDYEGLPVALLEAMAHGLTPVVTHINSGNTQLVRDGENGFVLPVGDTAGFADRISSLAADRARLASMGRAAWHTSAMYSIDKMVENYIVAFTETVQKVSERRERAGVTPDYPVMASCRSKYPFWLRKIKQRVVTLGS